MNRSRSLWIWGAVILLLVFVFAAVVGRVIDSIGEPQPSDGAAASSGPTTPPNAVGITIASSNTKEAWLHQAVEAFNTAATTDGRDGESPPVRVTKDDDLSLTVTDSSGCTDADTRQVTFHPVLDVR